MSERSLLRYRFEVVSRWPDSTRKFAYLRAILSRLERLKT